MCIVITVIYKAHLLCRLWRMYLTAATAGALNLVLKVHSECIILPIQIFKAFFGGFIKESSETDIS